MEQRPTTQGKADSNNPHHPGHLHGVKNGQFFIFNFVFLWYPMCTHYVPQENTTQGISENGMPRGASISFSQIMPCKFLHSITIPPNTLQILSKVLLECQMACWQALPCEFGWDFNQIIAFNPPISESK